MASDDEGKKKIPAAAEAAPPKLNWALSRLATNPTAARQMRGIVDEVHAAKQVLTTDGWRGHGLKSVEKFLEERRVVQMAAASAAPRRG